MGERARTPSGSSGTPAASQADAAKISEAVAPEVSRVLSAYTQQVQKALQGYVEQITAQWQSGLQAYVDQFNRQRQDIVRGVSVKRPETPDTESGQWDLDAEFAIAAKPLEDMSQALLHALNVVVEQFTQQINMAMSFRPNGTSTRDREEDE